MVDYIIFDLDGTLIDTLEGITVAVNETLKEVGLDYYYTKSEVKTFIGKGAKNLITLAFKRNLSSEEFELFLKNYEKYQYVSKAFPNVMEVLKELNERNIPIIVYSNKPNELLQKLMEFVFNDIKFSYLQGQDLNYPTKPDVTLLKKIIKHLKLEEKNGLFVGDSVVDILTAKNINMNCLILTYGYGNIIEMDKETNKTYINDFKEVLKFI